MDLLTVNVMIHHQSKSFHFYQQNTVEQAKQFIISSLEGESENVYNYGLFQSFQGGEDFLSDGLFLDERKTFAAYRLYGTVMLYFVPKQKLGMQNKKQLKLFPAVQSKKIEKLKELLQTNDPNVRDEKGLTPLHYATLADNKLVMQTLIEGGAFIDYRDKDERTPLHIAAMNNKSGAAHFLVTLGHLLDCRDRLGLTPLFYAVQLNFAHMVRYLLEQGGTDLDIEDGNNQLMLHHAIKNNSPVMVSDLLQHGATVFNDKQCLHLAVGNGLDEITRILLQNGFEKNALNQKGDTCATVAANTGNVQIYKILESYHHGALHNGAHPYAQYPLELQDVRTSTIKKGRVGTLKLKKTFGSSTESLKRNGSMASVASMGSIYMESTPLATPTSAKPTANGLLEENIALKKEVERLRNILIHYNIQID